MLNYKPDSVTVFKEEIPSALFRQVEDEPIEEPPKVEVKIEKKEADLKVFLGPENVFPSDNPFSAKRQGISSEVSFKVRNRLSSMTTLFDKLKKLEENDGSDQVVEAETRPKKSIRNVIQVENLKTDDEKADTEELKILSTKEPKVYCHSVQNIIDRLNSKVGGSNPESGDHSPNVSVSLLDIVKGIKKVARPEIEEVIDGDVDDDFLAPFSQRFNFERLTKVCSSELKDDGCLRELLKPGNLKHLFKCMAKSECSFSSDNAGKFKLHLEEVHGAQKPKLRQGWLRCSVCLRKLGLPSSLISHVIKEHGSSTFQCPHCLFRDSSEMGLLLHQQISHPDLQKGFIQCKGFKSSEQQKATNEMSLRVPRMKCREKNCAFETSSSVEMSQHLFLDHDGKTAGSFRDFGCLLCSEAFQSVTHLVCLKLLLDFV